nr:KH domain-containing protein akap-1 [Leptinotarsa decemlineata]XP_023029396.1 KH domain-containing protein akap-1 [Leptinotarsa decemlineata]
MAPFHSRQSLLTWGLPTVAVLLSYLWYKRKRIGARSDPGDTRFLEEKKLADIGSESKNEQLESADRAAPELSTPNKTISRSLSGVESPPIDIVFPVELRANKSTSVVISDEDLDLEIEKIKSMRNGSLYGSKMDNSSSVRSKSNTPLPIKENKPVKQRKGSKKKNPPQVQKEIEIVEDKLIALTVADNKNSPKERDSQNLDLDIAGHVQLQRQNSGRDSANHSPSQSQNLDLDVAGHVELQRQNSGRDSANHSPSDVMLNSPSMSSISDNHSEGSSDSGKGGSDVTTPPLCSAPGVDVSSDVFTQHTFEVRQNLVGKLIGKKGSFVQSIRSKTNASVVVIEHHTDSHLKLCVVRGTQTEIDAALKMVRNKFPAKRFPELTLDDVMLPPPTDFIPLNNDKLFVNLVEGIPNDNILSCLVTPNHLFLQHPIHPSYPSLQWLTNHMNAFYSEPNSPVLQTPIQENSLCVAYSVDTWCRAVVLSTDVDSDTSYVKILDYGGYAYVDNSNLRQMRFDFMLLPFQASECILANIRSINEDGSWPKEAYDLVADAARSSMMSTYVIGYTEDNVPLVYIHVLFGSQPILLNKHLVECGFAEWVPLLNTVSEPVIDDSEEGAVGGSLQ